MQKSLSCIHHVFLQLAATMLFGLMYVPDSVAGGQRESVYFKMAQARESDLHDLDIVSLGSLVLNADQVTHFDLTRIKSVLNGDAYTLEFGGGYNYQGLYVSLGISMGHNSDTSENLFAYFPEVGLVLDVTNELAATISARRYHRLYHEEERVVMVGLLIRQ